MARRHSLIMLGGAIGLAYAFLTIPITVEAGSYDLYSNTRVLIYDSGVGYTIQPGDLSITLQNPSAIQSGSATGSGSFSNSVSVFAGGTYSYDPPYSGSEMLLNSLSSNASAAYTEFASTSISQTQTLVFSNLQPVGSQWSTAFNISVVLDTNYSFAWNYSAIINDAFDFVLSGSNSYHYHDGLTEVTQTFASYGPSTAFPGGNGSSGGIVTLTIFDLAPGESFTLDIVSVLSGEIKGKSYQPPVGGGGTGSPVPEPSTVMLLGSGLLGLLGYAGKCMMK